MILVYRYRVKSLSGLLNRQAVACNIVWNYCNDRQKDALRFARPWLSGFDLNKLTAGSSKELGIHSGTVNAVCEQYAKSRAQHKRPFLRFRGKRSLGWIPIKGRELKRDGDAFRFAGKKFRVFFSRPLPEGKIKDGTNFSRDARGNWYLNIVIAVDTPQINHRSSENGVGIDLGLKDFASLSTGEKIEAPRIFRAAEAGLATAQRARKKRRIKMIHAKIANCRSDFLHKLSDRIAKQFGYIAVGNVTSAKLAKTSMAKSVLDAGWSSFRNQLAYKALKHGARFEEVDESFTTQICSNCGAKPVSRPKGIADLGIREWQCSVCECSYDRDTNAAINILRRGRATLAVGIPVTVDGKDVKIQKPFPANRRVIAVEIANLLSLRHTTKCLVREAEAGRPATEMLLTPRGDIPRHMLFRYAEVSFAISLKKVCAARKVLFRLTAAAGGEGANPVVNEGVTKFGD